MQIHYFQRYHEKENVATANTMLLLSRLYSYSSDKFFRLLKSEFFSDSFEPEIVFNLQEKSVESIPDATITQEGFKIVVETKMGDYFSTEQLKRHLKAFGEEQYKVIISLAPEFMSNDTKNSFEEILKEYNKQTQIHPIIHINTTFETLANAIQEILDDRDYDMQDVLDDYLNYCYKDGLISVSDSWKYLRMQLAGTTLNFNIENNMYYDNADRGFRPHEYLGLYKDKSVRAIGKICAIFTVTDSENGLEYESELGELTDEYRHKINLAIEDGYTHNYDLLSKKHRYFFVEKFFETDFKKITPKGAMGTRIFDLSQILNTDTLPETEKIAELLKDKSWT